MNNTATSNFKFYFLSSPPPTQFLLCEGVCVLGEVQGNQYNAYILLLRFCVYILHVCWSCTPLLVRKMSSGAWTASKLSVTRWWRNSQSPDGGDTVTVTRWWRNCHSHQMVETLPQSPDGGETVTVTRWWRNCHSHQKTWKSSSHTATNIMLRVQNYVSRNSCERLEEAKILDKTPPVSALRRDVCGVAALFLQGACCLVGPHWPGGQWRRRAAPR